MDEKMIKLLLCTVVFSAFPLFSKVIFTENQPYFLHGENAFKLDSVSVSETEFHNLLQNHDVKAEINSALSHRPLTSADLKQHMSPVKNQGQRRTCGVFSTLALLEHLTPNIDYSEQCASYFATPQDAILPTEFLSFIENNGIYAEKDCPYRDPARDPLWTRTKPNERLALETKARNTIPNLENATKTYPAFSSEIVPVSSHSPAQAINYIKDKLSAGTPVGVTTFVAGKQWGTGLISKIPSEEDIKSSCGKSLLSSAHKKCAAHAIVFTGYDDEQRLFFFKNSWAKSWGLTDAYQIPRAPHRVPTGYGAMSYDYYARFRLNHVITLNS